MFEKMGQSLADTGRFEIHIFGYPTKTAIHSEIKLHPSKAFKRLSLSRLIQPLKILTTILRLKPKFVIITTHELLGISALIKLMLKCRLVYDIQENYYRNIRYTNAFPYWISPLLAVYVRVKEIVLSLLIDFFILAEKGYISELRFLAKETIIIENKLKRPAVNYAKKSSSDNLVHLLFSGTLAETTGVFNAIKLVKSLHLQEPKIRLTIIGYCAQTSILSKIRNEIEGFNFIELIGGNTLVPHREIIKQVQESDYGIISYLPNKSTENRIPTKLYEYLGCKLPILLIKQQTWVDYCSPYQACIPIEDFSKLDIQYLLNQLTTAQFYQTTPKNVFWESEAAKLIKQIDET